MEITYARTLKTGAFPENEDYCRHGPCGSRRGAMLLPGFRRYLFGLARFLKR